MLFFMRNFTIVCWPWAGRMQNSSTFYRPPMSEEKYMHYQLTRPALSRGGAMKHEPMISRKTCHVRAAERCSGQHKDRISRPMRVGIDHFQYRAYAESRSAMRRLDCDASARSPTRFCYHSVNQNRDVLAVASKKRGFDNTRTLIS